MRRHLRHGPLRERRCAQLTNPLALTSTKLAAKLDKTKQPFVPAGGTSWSGVGKETAKGAEVSRGITHSTLSKAASAQVVAEFGTWYARSWADVVSSAAAEEERENERLVTLIGEALGPTSGIVAPGGHMR